MAHEVGGFTKGTTGNATVLLNKSFTPALLELDIGPRTSTNETDVRRSTGATDDTAQYAMSTYTNGTTRITRETTSYCITHYEGTTLKIRASFVSFGADEFTLNFETANSGYTIRFRASS